MDSSDEKVGGSSEHTDTKDDLLLSPDGHTLEDTRGAQDGGNVCSFFLKGKCHFGQRCRMSHSEPLAPHEAAAPDQEDERDGWEKVKKKKKTNEKKPRRPRENEERVVNKKPRMRTADDVISRILWDPLLDEAHFVVGYVDRFLGVLERPFSEFNWDTDPCDCDYTTELALPRHRIQYFTYRGQRVWDRHSRTDLVFGSTGQSLAPPFGGEEEVRDVKEGGDGEQTPEVQPPAGSETEECSHAGKTHLEEEEEKNAGLNILSPDSAEQAPTCRSVTAEESHGSRDDDDDDDDDDVEEAAHSLQASTITSSKSEETEGEKEEECGESLDIDEAPANPPAAPEQKPGGRPGRKKPTHFITFKANTPAILTCFQQLQEEMVALLPASAPYWQQASSLHVTLCLLNLSGPEEVEGAAVLLKRFAAFHRNPPLTLSFPLKLKHFGGKVLILSPQPHLALQHFNEGLQEVFSERGLLHRASYSPRYHLTLAKVTEPGAERMFEGVGDLKLGKGLNFGRLPVNTLHLCVVSGPLVDGFYQTLCSVSLR